MYRYPCIRLDLKEKAHVYRQPLHQANYKCIFQAETSCIFFMPTLQALLQAYFQAEPEIKYHALGTSILNITGYNSIPFTDIFIPRIVCACSMSFDTSQLESTIIKRNQTPNNSDAIMANAST